MYAKTVFVSEYIHTYSKIRSSQSTHLPLSQGDGGEFLAKLHLLCKLVQVICWVSALREDEDEGSFRPGVLEGNRKFCSLRLNELLTELTGHIVL